MSDLPYGGRLSTDEWRRHPRLWELGWWLTYDLAWAGRTREAVALLRRIYGRPRVARAVLSSAACGRLPYSLAHKRHGVDDEELRQLLEEMRPYLTVYGLRHLELALHLLDVQEAHDGLAVADPISGGPPAPAAPACLSRPSRVGYHDGGPGA